MNKRYKTLNKNNLDNNMQVRDALSMLVKKGNYKELWQSSGFLQVYDLSKYIQKSAGLLKKHLPPRYHKDIRFLQNPDTWVLSVLDDKTSSILKDLLATNYNSVSHTKSGLPQHVKLIRIYQNKNKNSELMSKLKPRNESYIERLQKIIPTYLHDKIYLRHQPSIWQINVKKGILATKVNLLLDELSMRIAKDIGFAPKLSIKVTPANWESSGFSISELSIEKKTIPTQKEAELYLSKFLSSKDY